MVVLGASLKMRGEGIERKDLLVELNSYTNR
jgi:hypothetical protein